MNDSPGFKNRNKFIYWEPDIQERVAAGRTYLYEYKETDWKLGVAVANAGLSFTNWILI